jgi:hypothetical protein
MRRPEFECDVCGRRRKGRAPLCRLCGLKVCDTCDYGQAGKGHLEAEHANERRSR